MSKSTPGEVVNVIFLFWCMFSAVTEGKDGEKETERVRDRRDKGEKVRASECSR